MFRSMRSFLRDRRGATVIEYGLIAALVAIGLVTVLGTVGTELTGVFNKVDAGFKRVP